MKLSLNSHKLGANLPLDEMIAICARHGVAGLEFSVGYGHKHGVELSAGAGELGRIRNRIAAAGLETVSVASYCRFDMEPEEEVAKNLQTAKDYIRLAAELECPIFRFVGNDLPDFLDRKAFIGRMAEVQRELWEYGKGYGVQALLSMHGTFQYRGDLAAMLALCGGKGGLVYNCDPGDVVGGSCEAVIDRLGDCIRHVHMHCLLMDFPYRELFGLLRDRGYGGWYSIVVDEPTAEPDRLIGYYARLAREWYHGQ